MSKEDFDHFCKTCEILLEDIVECADIVKCARKINDQIQQMKGEYKRIYELHEYRLKGVNQLRKEKYEAFESRNTENMLPKATKKQD